MDRCEGRVANIILTGDMGELVKALESGRERLLQARQPQQAIEGEVVTPQPVVVSDAVIAPENPYAEPIPH